MPVKKSPSAATKTSKAPKTTKKKVSSASKEKKSKTFLSPVIAKGWRNLVIVESPAKAKTIKKFLGNEFEVKASMGHVVELADKKMDLLVGNGFNPTYEIADGKKNVVSDLRSSAKTASQVWIATDEDREWEAIGWHISRLLKLDPEKTPRIVFHEITKDAIQHAIEHPRTLDMALVHAQQSRSVLDKLVWFTVSPLLWQKIRNGLSAWRVQSVAVKLLVEKEKEIQAFIPEEFWKLKAQLVHQKQAFEIEFAKKSGKSFEIKNKDQLEEILSPLWINAPDETTQDKKSNTFQYLYKKIVDFVLDDIVVKEAKKTPPAPFITSTLQQRGSSLFGRSVKQVMSTAQMLYENGYITYMRTDSVNLSTLAINNAIDYVTKTFGEKYVKARTYKGKDKNAQEAHEAIRPTDMFKSPEKSWLTGNELKLYSLIWKRTVATQMADALLEQTSYLFVPQGVQQEWIAKGEVVIFDGFLKLMGRDEEDDVLLPKIDLQTLVKSVQLNADQQFTKPPARYSEATLVKALESKGIGRPSTYAPTITTIQTRWYAEKIEKRLKPTDIAFVVNDYLEKQFPELMNYDFTAQMEAQLDQVAEGEVNRKMMLEKFYEGFELQLKAAGKAEREKVLVGKKCPKCNDGDLVYKFTKVGKFIGCSNYPTCDYTEKSEEENTKLAPIKEKYEWKLAKEFFEDGPDGAKLMVKMWRFGPFLTTDQYPAVKWIKSVPDEKILELEKQFGGGVCDVCKKGTMHVKKSKRWPFLACSRYPDCKNAKPLPKQSSSE